MDSAASVAAAAARAARPGKTLKYGTAGFRDVAEVLESTFLRMGMLAVLRSRQQGGRAVGLMVTASHNPVQDNGLKMVDPDGGMLEASWEAHAMAVANADDVPAALAAVAAAEGVPAEGAAVVFVARDTRPSSPALTRLSVAGAAALGCTPVNLGVLTTPQLHHIVRMHNLGEERWLWASEEGYYSMLGEAYAALTEGCDNAARSPLVVDCANGVGAPSMARMAERLGGGLLSVQLRNTGEGELNHECGAEHVQKKRSPPQGFAPGAADNGARCCSFDGDADRIVYHFHDAEGRWALLDGDKIAALIAGFLREQLQALGIAGEFSMAAVQTAYANGASTRYIEAQGVAVPIAKTGVKFVHHEALNYDIGLYFEANGHGTVVFRPCVAERLAGFDAQGDAAKELALRRLRAALQLINQAVGDAISDALMVEAVLAVRGWTLADWAALYADLPSRQTKLRVADRTAVVPVADETRVTQPPELQAAIDAAVARYAQGRAFVRPSGTEDVVRVYAEAASEEEALALARDVAAAAHDLAGGNGDPVTTFMHDLGFC